MILVKPSFEIMEIMAFGATGKSSLHPLELIESAGRTCYKSKDKICRDSAIKFVEMITKRGHESVIEHSAMTVRIICDRGVTHEIVRHRLAAYSQESTRYVNYKGGCTFVIPPWITINADEYTGGEFYNKGLDNQTLDWIDAMFNSESAYVELIDGGWSPQQARSVLPNSTKTEIVVTANFREWRHIFNLRTAKAAHPQMREIMIPLLEECKEHIPIIFENIKS